MSDYTPTTEDIRTAWTHGYHGDNYPGAEATDAEFDRWLAAHDAEVRQGGDYHEGFEEGLKVGRAEVRAGVVAEEPEWEYVPGWIAADGRARISQGVIAPSYVAEFIAEGGEVVRRRVSKFETVTADMVPVKQEGADDV